MKIPAKIKLLGFRWDNRHLAACLGIVVLLEMAFAAFVFFHYFLPALRPFNPIGVITDKTRVSVDKKLYNQIFNRLEQRIGPSIKPSLLPVAGQQNYGHNGTDPPRISPPANKNTNLRLKNN